jgi:hypothetical protein
VSPHKDDVQVTPEVQNALKQDSLAIISPPELDKKILSMAKAKAAERATLRRRHRFGFWHYCTAASAAVFLVLTTSYLTRQTEMVDAVKPQSMDSMKVYSEVQLAPERAQSKRQAVAVEAVAETDRVIENRQEAMQGAAINTLDRETKQAQEEGVLRSQMKERLSVIEKKHMRGMINSVDCQTLTISQALLAQKTYVEAYTRRLLAEQPALSDHVNTWRQYVMAKISSEQALYQQLLRAGTITDTHWRENWWLAYDQAPRAVPPAADLVGAFDKSVKCVFTK